VRYDELFDVDILPTLFCDCLFVILVNVHITLDHEIFNEVVLVFEKVDECLSALVIDLIVFQVQVKQVCVILKS